MSATTQTTHRPCQDRWRPICGWLVLCALLASGCGPGERMTPQPIKNLDEIEAMGHIPKLRPHIKKLVDEIVAGRLLGDDAADYADEFKLADRVSQVKGMKCYLFRADPKMAGHEGSTTLYVFVQNDFNHIVRCYALTLEY